MEKEIIDLLKEMNGRMINIDTKVDNIDRRLEKVEDKVERIEVQQDENTKVLRSLEHASEIHKSEMDKLNYSIARIEGKVESIKSDLNAVEIITSKNWNEIANLKIAK